MRVILDECLPRKLRRELIGHIVTTVPQAGFAGLTNGRLLKRLEGAYDAFITIDGSLSMQQPLSSFKLGIIVLHARSNKVSDLLTLVPTILGALATIKPGDVTHVP